MAHQLIEAPVKPKLRINRLVKEFGGVRAVDEVSLAVNPGEFLTLLGPSGSGKTTLLLMVAGLVVPSGGEIWIGDDLATYKPPYERDIGMVFQNYALFPHMTVADNVAFPLRMRRVRESEIVRRVREALELVRLPQMGARFPRQLSGGQQQRVALARALVFNPSVLLMDEPLGALDKKLREHVQYELKALQTSLRITVLYVTHDQDEALTMSDRICLMRNGGIEQIGTPHELYRAPRTHFVADFLGESNFLPGTVSAVSTLVNVRLADGTTVVVPPRRDVRVGEEALILIRPEALSFAEPRSQQTNMVEGRISQITFMGGVTRYAVKLDEGREVVVKRLNGSAADAREIGQRLALGWEPADSVLL